MLFNAAGPEMYVCNRYDLCTDSGCPLMKPHNGKNDRNPYCAARGVVRVFNKRVLPSPIGGWRFERPREDMMGPVPPRDFPKNCRGCVEFGSDLCESCRNQPY